MNTRKRVLRTLLFSTLTVGAAAVEPPRAEACSCIPQPPPTEALAQASAVFEGSVVGGGSIVDSTSSANPGFHESQVQFRVLRAWKGVRTGSIVTLAMPSGGGASCGFDSIEDRSTWLVYAHEFEGALTTNICTRTRPSKYAATDFAELDSTSPTGPNDGGCSVAGTHPWRGTAIVAGALTLLAVVGRRRRARPVVSTAPGVCQV